MEATKPVYRGVSAENIANSLLAAIEFVYFIADQEDFAQKERDQSALTLSTRKYVDEQPMGLARISGALKKVWLRQAQKFDDREPFDTVVEHMDQITAEDIHAIRHAASEIELAQAIKKPKALLLEIDDLFLHHGVRDAGNMGFFVYRALHEWDAFNGMTHLMPTPVNRAMERHLEAYPVTHEDKAAFYRALPAPYIRRYGIAMPEGTSITLGEAMELLEDPQMQDRILNAIGPFAEIDEAPMIGVGSFGGEGQFVGLTFDTSLAGARAVALEFSEQVVLDPYGNQVHPHAIEPVRIPKIGPEPGA